MANPYEDELSSTGQDTLANSDLIEQTSLQGAEIEAESDIKQNLNQLVQKQLTKEN